jgi:putative membrane protein
MRLKLPSRDQATASSVPQQPAGTSELAAREDPGLPQTQQAQPAQQAQPVQPGPGQAPVTPPPGINSKGKVRRTRASAWWVGLLIAAVILVALVIFIAQNSATVAVRYLGVQGHVSLAIALVLSAVAGILLVAIPGTARMIQLRRALKKNAGGTSR